MIADDKYSLLNRNKLTQPVQILLSSNQKNFSQLFPAFLKSTLNFEHFRKKDDPQSRCISQITDSEKGAYINVWKIMFQRTPPDATWQTGPNTPAIWTTAPLPHLLVTVNIIHLEKVYFSAMLNFETVC